MPQRKRRTQATTLRQVAEHAGCSIPAAAGALHDGGGTARVSEALRQRVRAAAKELGYRPNYHARALRERRSRVLGLTLGPGGGGISQSGFWGQIISGLTQSAPAAGYSLLFIGEENLSAAVERVQRHQVDALLVPHLLYSHETSFVEAQEVPIVWMFPPPDSRHPGVSLDHTTGLKETAAHLAELGHREVLWMGRSQQGIVQVPERFEHFEQACALFNIKLKTLNVETAAFIPQGELVRLFYQALQAHLHRHRPPTAIMVYNDTAALGVYIALGESGLSVPGDVSVIGFDDLNAELAWPPMSVVSLQLPLLGRAWAKLAINFISQSDYKAVELSQSVPTRLIVRDSTGRSRAVFP